MRTGNRPRKPAGGVGLGSRGRCLPPGELEPKAAPTENGTSAFSKSEQQGKVREGPGVQPVREASSGQPTEPRPESAERGLEASWERHSGCRG